MIGDAKRRAPNGNSLVRWPRSVGRALSTTPHSPLVTIRFGAERDGSPGQRRGSTRRIRARARAGSLCARRIEDELSRLLGGRRVDLRTAEDLRRYFRDDVVRTAET